MERLASRGVPTRVASRAADPSFDWGDQSTWDAVLDGVTAAYVSYAPDLAIPGAADSIRAFVKKAVEQGVQRLVLLCGTYRHHIKRRRRNEPADTDRRVNDQLAAVSATDPATRDVWDHYLNRWTMWNHVRTVAAMVAALLYPVGLMQNGSTWLARSFHTVWVIR